MIVHDLQKRLRRAFSHAANNYDALTTLHKTIGRELVRKTVAKENCSRILDVGCGTGYITKKMKFYFPDAQTIGLDLAEGMLDHAQRQLIEENIQWVQADATHLPFKKQTFDIIISNLSYQWIEDLAGAFASCHSKLSQDGIFCATLFGARTFEELFTSLEAISAQPRGIRRLVTMEMIERNIRAVGFKDIKVDFELIKVEFIDLWDLLKWTKSIGANLLPREHFIGRDLLERAAQHYRKNFPYHDGVAATLEIIWIYAEK